MDEELEAERAYVHRLYARVDRLRERASERLRRTLSERATSPSGRVERDASHDHYSARLAQLAAVEHHLCFGRLDMLDGERRYIGRAGLLDDDLSPLLLDWRAPASRPFYAATAASPEGVARRRHLRTEGRDVVSVEDEVLDPDLVDETTRPGSDTALLAALNAERTGRMQDIVRTIQAEQDRIIRDDQHGVLVVQGGPGTGKTAIALHRAAYLLYTYREQLARRGVLVIGPTATFLRYVGKVLPSLGETAVVLSTVDELYPGVTVTADDPPLAAEVKGRGSMATVLAAAVRASRRVPPGGITVRVDGVPLTVDARACRRAMDRALSERLPHNAARPVFAKAFAGALADVAARALGDADGPPGAEHRRLRREFERDEAFDRVVDRLWPALTPERLLAGLFASDDLLARAAPRLTEEERRALRREPDSGWTPADVPLLDEIAEVLGVDDSREVERERASRARDVAHAERVLDAVGEYAGVGGLSARDVIDAEGLADRHADRDTRSIAERAAADRTWAFGHVVVDEAQELSEMAWRAVIRRCPTKSMTIVGDIAQSSTSAASWAERLAPHVADRWRLETLTVNYRTPAELMAVAGEVLAELDPDAAPPLSVRSTGTKPWYVTLPEADVAAAVPRLARAEAAAAGRGTVGVLVPAAGPPLAGVESERVSVLTVRDAKGLEFDSVVVVDPARIVAESPRGLSDLYVALARGTQRLGIVGVGSLPPVLRRLVPELIEERVPPAAG